MATRAVAIPARQPSNAGYAVIVCIGKKCVLDDVKEITAKHVISTSYITFLGMLQ